MAAFRWFNETGEWEKHFSAWERYLVIYVGAAAMWIIGKRLKVKLSVWNLDMSVLIKPS